ncbi:hypothetical protein FS749_006328 [Ceratobasidium sp. UAMH 11750]|nr:hypothetical protein FS749_006328 [Ceratobasidium sp. UAMH 11750]
MFIPRSLAKRVPKPVESSTSSNNYSTTAEPQLGPSNPKKRVTPSTNYADSDGSHKNASSTSTSDSGSSSDSDSDEDEQQSTSAPAEGTNPKSSGVMNRQEQTQSEIAAQLELALSDLSLWRTESLFWRVSETQDWYLPFSRLHDHLLLAPYLGESSTRVPDAALVNALRTYGSGAFESRMKIRTPSNAAWKGKTASGWVGAGGGYELRCKAWEGRKEGWMDELAGMGEEEWEARMVYVERVPPTIRSVWALYHYITTLAHTSHPNEQHPESQVVQDVFVPAAEPAIVERPLDTTQRFRGQAFVVFSTLELAQAFSKRWTWDLPTRSNGALDLGKQTAGNWNTGDAVTAAMASGFRSITKARWDKLKSEYLDHQTRVLRQNPKSKRRPPTHDEQSTSSLAQAPVPSTTHPKPSRATHPPPFPPGILVFVRRLHPETNKTTLKTLFGHAFPDGLGDNIEYLDFQKGVDSAHIRLRTPADASTLVAHVASHPLTQQGGLDSDGQPCERGMEIEAEVVSGIREANYWEKVPEKVRIAAVNRAGLGETEDRSGESGQRKRRRKG